MGLETKRPAFSPSLCVTHNCNLNCVYCYQEHDAGRMSIDVAQKAIDWIFNNVPEGMDGIEIGFIGGEPLLEYELIKEIVDYTCSKKRNDKFIFYATTNGVLLTSEMKEWFTTHQNCFVLGLSLDGAKETHDYNRCNSFDKIDVEFFRSTWPNQGVKMTLTEYSLMHLAENIKFIHSLGFREISGVNLFEGDFDWGNDIYIDLLIPQLKELVEYYTHNDTLPINQMLNRHLHLCEDKHRIKRSWCGIGNGANFFDVDGKIFPCPLVTPMTFGDKDISDILKTDFTKAESLVDDDCFEKCYLYPVCPTCAGANYLVSKSFKIRDKRRCKIQKLVSLFAADLQAKRIKKNPKALDDNTLYYTIEAIKKIRQLFLPEFEGFLRKGEYSIGE